MSPTPSVIKLIPVGVAAPTVKAIIKPPAIDYITPNNPTVTTPFHGIGEES